MPQPCLGRTGAVGADQDRRAMAILVGDLRQRLIGHLDVVGGGVRVRVSRPQHPRQRLPGVVRPRQQRMITKPVLERRRRTLFLRMTGHQGGVHVDHQARNDSAGTPHSGNRPPCLAAQQPGPFPGRHPCHLHLLQQRLLDRAEDPPGRRGRGHRPEHAGLVTQHRQVADRHSAVGKHHRQISQHPARRMRRASLPATG
jgi:hypothetical protein